MDFYTYTTYTKSEQETEILGEKLAKQLSPGSIIAYEGDLGAGKTALTRGLARGLGITERITSPTYTIVNEYNGKIPLFHFDLYRISSYDDLFELGWEEYIERGGILAIEWSSRISEELNEALHIKIEKASDQETYRAISLRGGRQYANLCL